MTTKEKITALVFLIVIAWVVIALNELQPSPVTQDGNTAPIRIDENGYVLTSSGRTVFNVDGVEQGVKAMGTTSPDPSAKPWMAIRVDENGYVICSPEGKTVKAAKHGVKTKDVKWPSAQVESKTVKSN